MVERRETQTQHVFHDNYMVLAKEGKWMNGRRSSGKDVGKDAQRNSCIRGAETVGEEDKIGGWKEGEKEEEEEEGNHPWQTFKGLSQS